MIDLPEELNSLLRIYFAKGGCYQTICSKLKTDSKHMFYDNKGRVMSSSQHMTLYWQHLLKAMDADFNFPPHR